MCGRVGWSGEAVGASATVTAVTQAAESHLKRDEISKPKLVGILDGVAACSADASADGADGGADGADGGADGADGAADRSSRYAYASRPECGSVHGCGVPVNTALWVG